MTAPIQLRESESTSLAWFMEARSTASDRESFRRTVAGLGARLRVDLGLREDAFAVVDTTEEPFLRTRGVAGTVVLSGRTLDVRPKHVQTADDSGWQAALLLMVERAGRRRAAYSRTRRLKFQSGTFLDGLAMGLALELEEATRHAEVRGYRSNRQELGQLRGRLLVTEQLRSSLLKPHKIICEVDELSADNPVNRLLHWAAGRLGSMATQPSVRRALSVQAGKLPTVSQPLGVPIQLSFRLPRQYQHYAGALELAKTFARGLTTAPGSSDVGGAGFLVGTERLFESFLERSLEAAMSGLHGWSVSAQDQSRFAIPVADHPASRPYFSKPDNVIRHDGAAVLLVDAKYKRFNDATEDAAGDRPSNGDIYQMVAACVAHDCNRALLVYPRMSSVDAGDDWVPIWWRVDFAGIELQIGAVTVPLQLLAAEQGLAEFDRRLQALVLTAAERRSRDSTEVAQ